MHGRLRAMKLGPLTFLLLASFPLLAQAPAPGPGDSITHTSAIGFSYTLPADWQVVEFPAPPTLPGIKKQAQQNATIKDEKKGIEDEKKDVSCVQIAFTARHGDPASVSSAIRVTPGVASNTIIAHPPGPKAPKDRRRAAPRGGAAPGGLLLQDLRLLRRD